jgi:SAM-dependent methyltransferase
VKCRHCAAQLSLKFIDLGSAPASNAFLTAEDLKAPEPHYPLRVLVCTRCWLVQTEDFARREELFSKEYPYFSSYAASWLKHAEAYVRHVIQAFELSPASMVAEIAANDGYLLQYVRGAGIPCYGVEPTASTAHAARSKGIEIVEQFFGKRLATELHSSGKAADLIVANNVLAHVPDLNDFAEGLATLLKPAGAITLEFPYLLNLVEWVQFDTIYHEHFSYFSLAALEAVFSKAGLEVFDVEHLPTHGGSLRIYAQLTACGKRQKHERLSALQGRENQAGVRSEAFYAGFQARAEEAGRGLKQFLAKARADGQAVAAYGAAAKGNTLLNFCGVTAKDIPFVVDRNEFKQGRFLPGSRIPVCSEARLSEGKPTWILILPWNLKAEISAQLEYARAWGARFVTAIPRIEFF